MERVQDAGAGFRSITESVDTTTSAGRMVMQKASLPPEGTLACRTNASERF